MATHPTELGATRIGRRVIFNPAVVEQICGRAVASETAHYIEYPWGRHDVPKYQDALQLRATGNG